MRASGNLRLPPYTIGFPTDENLDAACRIEVFMCDIPLCDRRIEVFTCDIPVCDRRIEVFTCDIPLCECRIDVFTSDTPVCECRIVVFECRLIKTGTLI
jgi:hypothetical protein